MKTNYSIKNYSKASISWPGILSRLLVFKGADILLLICYMYAFDLSEFPLLESDKIFLKVFFPNIFSPSFLGFLCKNAEHFC